MKTKTKSYEIQATGFHNDKVLKVDSSHTWLVVILLASIFVDKNYYPQVFFTECKFIKSKITDDLETFSDGSDEECIKGKYQDFLWQGNIENINFESAIWSCKLTAKC